MTGHRTLKERLHGGERLAGLFVMLPSPAVVEMCGHAGFDFVIIDQEHGAAGSETLENQLRAADASGIEALVRVSSGTVENIQRALDAGASGIVVPHVMDAEYARQIVAGAHYPPLGRRGIATTARAGRHGMITVPEHLQNATRRTLVVPQIEDREALPNIPAIAAVEGIDALFIGPADLSMSLGHPGNPAHPDVQAAIEGICRDARGGKTRLAMFVRNAAEVAELKKREIPMACFSTTSVFSNALMQLAKELKE